MGACVSTHHKPSAMKLHVTFGSNHKSDHQLSIPPSPTKEKPPIVYGDVPFKPQWPSRDFGSKEETFFDSQAWLESDCDEDFMSVNGEFTPSRGNTPVHHNFSAGTPRVKGGAPTIDGHQPSVTPSQQSPSPTKKKKRLSELFKESLRVNLDLEEENAEPANENGVVGSLEAAAVHGGGLKPKRERWGVAVEGCLPSLLSSCRPVTPQQMVGRRKRA